MRLLLIVLVIVGSHAEPSSDAILMRQFLGLALGKGEVNVNVSRVLDHVSKGNEEHWNGRSDIVSARSGMDLASLGEEADCGLVLLLSGGPPPRRRSAATPYLQIVPEGALPAAEISRAVEVLEGLLGRRFFPLEVILHAFDRFKLGGISSPGCRPYVIYEVSTGRMLLDSSLSSLLTQPHPAKALVQQASDTFFDYLKSSLAQVGSSPPPSVHTLINRGAALAVAVALLPAVPLWFCMMCPVVLGLLAPLVINLGLGQLADQVCKEFNMDQDECFDLWLGALALGFVLSLASALPIFKVCRLYECEHHQGLAGARV